MTIEKRDIIYSTRELLKLVTDAVIQDDWEDNFLEVLKNIRLKLTNIDNMLI